MRHRRLGQTDLELSILGFGASPLGNVFSVVDPAESTRAVHQAIDWGINFFDVSPYYGVTLAEQRLGMALDGKRHEVILTTKCGRYGADDFDFSARTIVAGVDASLARLKTDYVDLLQVHDVEFGDVEQIVTETLPALRGLQQLGKTRYIGITGYSLETLITIAQLAPVDSILSYCRYNLMVQDMDEILTPLAKSKSIGLINASPLHMGVLSPGEIPTWHPAPPEIRAAGHRANEICKSHGLRLTEVALRFCLAHSYVSSTLVGMSTVKELEENLRALDPSEDASVIQEIITAIGSDFNYVWPSGRIDYAESSDHVETHDRSY
ncbi:aldo/keto reductase [Tunturiibacter gelidoferens]|uniref:L-galactose dehydrogenase n=1 Tax=Tunturiibacter gelidiferens TaxID=3069689 RepID=A0A9X0QCT6_9BACT|nr:aldo/keto reductase [Edaphobacter lichenicola]MBB5327959.1 L-galactose dehydrogenase [Edaphobacter lichenicola]